MSCSRCVGSHACRCSISCRVVAHGWPSRLQLPSFRTRDVPERSARAQLLDFDALDFLNLLEWLRSPRRNSREIWGGSSPKECCAHVSCLRAMCAPARAASQGHRPPERHRAVSPSQGHRERNPGVVASCLGARRAHLGRSSGVPVAEMRAIACRARAGL